jgi:serine/threonine-protein kinase
MILPIETLGKYRILEELGRGGFATVYRAEDSTLGREVALKVLHPQLLTEAGWVERFHREARAIARLRHPHIITIYEIGEAEGRLFITMELFKAGSIQDRLAQQGCYPWAEAMTVLQGIAAALDYAHGEGIIHRDLKPANILLDPHTGAVLTDFGFAKLVGESSMSLSLSGGVMGTPAYIAPEIWDGQDPTAQSDIYALGCVVYELLTGGRLFEGKTPSVVMRKHLLDGPQFPASWPEGTPQGVEDVLRKALAREPAGRYASAGELLAALRHLEAEELRRKEEAVIRRQREAEAVAAAARERARLQAETEKQRAAQEAAQKQAAAAAAQRQQWETEQAAVAAARERERYQAEQVAPPQPAVFAPVQQQPAPRSASKHKAFPRWTWAPLSIVGLVAIVSLIGGLRWLLTPADQPFAEPTTQTRPADGMAMVYVPEGEFRMGSTKGDSDEEPVHTVALDGFWIDRTEVTNAQYQKCVTAGRCDPSDYVSDSGFNGANQPVVGVSWHDAVAYCEWAGGRLPTEAEWEYAARGPEGLTYPWGNRFDGARLNFCDRSCSSSWMVWKANDGYEYTAPVGSYPDGASWIGALDLSGNVWEWVADWYGTYPSGRQVNPTGPQSGDYRVLRGGSWGNVEDHTRGADRFRNTPSNTYYIFYGFRCGVSAAPGP